MRVKDLIIALQKMPQDAPVLHVWDGAARTSIEFVWVANDGNVITADYGQVVYGDDDRPKHAPTKAQDAHWQTAEDPEED